MSVQILLESTEHFYEAYFEQVRLFRRVLTWNAKVFIAGLLAAIFTKILTGFDAMPEEGAIYDVAAFLNSTGIYAALITFFGFGFMMGVLFGFVAVRYSGRLQLLSQRAAAYVLGAGLMVLSTFSYLFLAVNLVRHWLGAGGENLIPHLYLQLFPFMFLVMGIVMVPKMLENREMRKYE